MEFRETITDLAGLRDVIAPPNDLVTAKETATFDDHCRDFIARSPFVLVASTDRARRVDISPKGDAPGFVRVVDSQTLAIPERPGNHRADTLVNVIEHPWVGLIFLVPGAKNTLRVRGRASIVRDLELRESLSASGRVPELALVVELTTAFFHCGKCVIRSKLWTAGGDLPESDSTLLARTMVEHGELELSVAEMQEIVVDDEETRLY